MVLGKAYITGLCAGPAKSEVATRVALASNPSDIEMAQHGGLVVRVTESRGTSLVDHLSDEGIATVRVRAIADTAAAERILRSVVRIDWVAITTGDGRLSCRLYGRRPRRLTSFHISAATALGLVRRGIPGVVSEGHA